MLHFKYVEPYVKIKNFAKFETKNLKTLYFRLFFKLAKTDNCGIFFYKISLDLQAFKYTYTDFYTIFIH